MKYLKNLIRKIARDPLPGKSLRREQEDTELLVLGMYDQGHDTKAIMSYLREEKGIRLKPRRIEECANNAEKRIGGSGEENLIRYLARLRNKGYSQEEVARVASHYFREDEEREARRVRESPAKIDHHLGKAKQKWESLEYRTFSGSSNIRWGDSENSKSDEAWGFLKVFKGYYESIR